MAPPSIATTTRATPIDRLPYSREAFSRDGLWGYHHAEDVGTRWYLVHMPTGWMPLQSYSSLSRARTATADGSALAILAADAFHALSTAPPENDICDLARALLTWLADHAPEALIVKE